MVSWATPASLVITVDCGTLAYQPLAAAKEMGLKVIVADHHLAEPELPECEALINPNRLDEAGDYRHLAAVGVALAVAVWRLGFTRIAKRNIARIRQGGLSVLVTDPDGTPLPRFRAASWDDRA